MTFGVNPVTGFPPPTPDEFPGGIQWQLDGVDVGDRTIDTVSFVSGDALAMEVDEDNSARLIITIPAGGGGSVPNLILSLAGASTGNFGGAEFADWTATSVLASADAEWSEDDGGIKLLSAGLYRVTIIGRASADSGAWPTHDGSSATKYGTVTNGTAAAVTPLGRSVHERSAVTSGAAEFSPGYVQWTDEYVVEAEEADQITIPTIYADHYNGVGTDVLFSALVVVTKL